ncbi:hypothetical protein GETHLI_03840 [Geothrix limicola]|uniref:Uncharacterized protein n=1 Tax=Geothrix limicola TaxID=2927978 RepID=A0ABQ5QB65_9BACT|nr:hypothetical protein [Geothrix limicola]GLH71882.1 hypothetical protein GETHLI_03840 [Geothrix limicola]
MPHPSPVTWALPPEVPWPRFLRLLRQPDPPRGWLECAADLPELKKRPLLLRWIAQHPKAPAHLRAHLLARLPWRALAAVTADAAAHPQARQQATEKLQQLWATMTTGERRSLALHAPRPLWPLVWRTPSASVLAAFLQHPKLSLEALVALIQPPLRPGQAEALAGSRWLEAEPVADQVLQALDRSLGLPDSGLALGHAAPWIRGLNEEARILTASRLVTPALRRLVHPRREEP